MSLSAPAPIVASQRALEKRPDEEPLALRPKRSRTVSELEGLVVKGNGLLHDLQQKMLDLGSQAVLVGEWQEEVTRELQRLKK